MEERKGGVEGGGIMEERKVEERKSRIDGEEENGGKESWRLPGWEYFLAAEVKRNLAGKCGGKRVEGTVRLLWKEGEVEEDDDAGSQEGWKGGRVMKGKRKGRTK
ncbi:hypothetical protein Pmani_038174 [Petrolisthes manimaculis]|uniref:Uncharacterized protein n=1 Tax=Petrolisthes manimaculis TaxID=1843537 RepID=A0AAE1NGB8_9EUCA|nr:hypothetical protein Pmani_038174 [Petrolisthes manimaculis]